MKQFDIRQKPLRFPIRERGAHFEVLLSNESSEYVSPDENQWIVCDSLATAKAIAETDVLRHEFCNEGKRDPSIARRFRKAAEAFERFHPCWVVHEFRRYADKCTSSSGRS